MNANIDPTGPRRLRPRRWIATIGTVAALAGGVGFVASGPASALPRQSGVSCNSVEARDYDLGQAGLDIDAADTYQAFADEDAAAGHSLRAANEQAAADSYYRSADAWMEMSEAPLC